MTTTQIRMRGYHEDRFGHVDHARYLEFLEDARWAHLEERGIDAAFLNNRGLFPVVVRLSIVYRRPARAGDSLTVSTRVLSTSRRKAVIGQEVRLEATNEVCVEGEVTAVFLDANTGRPIALTDDILQAWPELGGP